MAQNGLLLLSRRSSKSVVTGSITVGRTKHPHPRKNVPRHKVFCREIQEGAKHSLEFVEMFVRERGLTEHLIVHLAGI